ncbi:MAG: hypothetical protein KC636_39485 [Myxococcales bacterium]|nr:hypothetical protein [Myxococcales bacterium]
MITIEDAVRRADAGETLRIAARSAHEAQQLAEALEHAAADPQAIRACVSVSSAAPPRVELRPGPASAWAIGQAAARLIKGIEIRKARARVLFDAGATPEQVEAILDVISYGDAEELAEISRRAAPALQAVLDDLIEERATPAAAERGAS